MKWMKIGLTTKTQAVDLVSSLFDDVGLEGIQIEDKVPISEEEKKAMFIDILPELPPDDGMALVSSYVEPDRDLRQLKEELERGLLELKEFVDIGEGTITMEEVDDKDWIDNWKEFFKPFRVAENIIIKPTWETLPDKREQDLVIEIDPGTAFGTGAHETTKLCVESLQEYITPESSLLDVGCGSGILSIIGIKLGAGHATAIDIDPAAIKASIENREENGIPEEKLRILCGNLLEEEALKEQVGIGCYDIVVANILAGVIIPLSGMISQYLKEGGIFVSSGIINTMEEPVRAAVRKHGFIIRKETRMGDWISFTAQKPQASPI